jgi:hypothetical protein
MLSLYNLKVCTNHTPYGPPQLDTYSDDNLSSGTDIDGLVFETALDESMAALVTDAVSFIASHVDLLPEGFADDHEVDDGKNDVIPAYCPYTYMRVKLGLMWALNGLAPESMSP